MAEAKRPKGHSLQWYKDKVADQQRQINERDKRIVKLTENLSDEEGAVKAQAARIRNLVSANVKLTRERDRLLRMVRNVTKSVSGLVGVLGNQARALADALFPKEEDDDAVQVVEVSGNE